MKLLHSVQPLSLMKTFVVWIILRNAFKVFPRFFTVSMSQEFLSWWQIKFTVTTEEFAFRPQCVHLQCDSVSMNGAYMTKSHSLLIYSFVCCHAFCWIGKHGTLYILEFCLTFILWDVKGCTVHFGKARGFLSSNDHVWIK